MTHIHTYISKQLKATSQYWTAVCSAPQETTARAIEAIISTYLPLLQPDSASPLIIRIITTL